MPHLLFSTALSKKKKKTSANRLVDVVLKAAYDFRLKTTRLEEKSAPAGLNMERGKRNQYQNGRGRKGAENVVSCFFF